MKKIIRKLRKWTIHFGFDPVVFLNSLRGIVFFLKDWRNFKKQRGPDKEFTKGPTVPVLNERFQRSGTMNGHYFHQDLLIARKIYENKPSKHVDIGSRTDGFVAHIAVFREIEVLDIRHQENCVRNIVFRNADLMKLPPDIENYCDSISALHSIEHFGLGRYGDIIDYSGHKKGLDNIYKILRKGGKFYFSAPIGKQRVEFNAHRVFSMEYLLREFKDKYQIDTFAYVDDFGDLFENCKLTDNEIKNNYGCIFGCGIFELTKL